MFNATGTHRQNTQQEFESMLGRDVVKNYRIVQNDCFNRDLY
ncbi:MAG: hypothetical protein DRP54_06510, partial [Spirochaetes bacterium]